MKGLCRLDSETHVGWLCRTVIDGINTSKWFSDASHMGDKALSKKAAKEWLTEHPAPKTARIVQSRKRKGTTTPHVGVSLCTIKRKDKTYQYYMVTWYPTKGAAKRKTFYVGNPDVVDPGLSQLMYEKAVAYREARVAAIRQ